jgi:hypothetical protein
MTFRKWLVAFLILLFLSPSILTVHAGPGPNELVLEHPWDEVRANPTVVKQPYSVPVRSSVYFYSVLPYNSGAFILVVEKKQEVVKKDLSVKNISLPRKK